MAKSRIAVFLSIAAANAFLCRVCCAGPFAPRRYATMAGTCPPKKMFFPVRDMDLYPHLIHGSLDAHASVSLNGILIGSAICTAHR